MGSEMCIRDRDMTHSIISLGQRTASSALLLWANCQPDTLPIPPIRENLGVLLRTCVRSRWLSLYAHTQRKTENAPYVSQTRTFENALFSAVCKKKQGKLWQKERGLDDASPLDKAIIVKKFRTHLHPGFVPVCRMPLQSERSRAIMPL